MKQNYFNNWYRSKLRLNWSSFYALLLITSVGITSMKAQVSAYTFSQSIGTFSSISGGTVLGVATGNTSATNLNSNVYPMTIPFAFNFNSQNYTSLNVSTNGFITFGTTPPGTTLAAPISGATAYDGAVSAFGHSISSFFDIAGKTGDISWTTEGVSPNREVVIQWTNFRPTSVTATTSVYAFSFQIRLQETTNKISVVYSAGSYLVGSAAYSSAVNQVGLRGATNADFNNRFNATTTSYDSSVAGDANGDDQAFSTVNATPGMPSDGLKYTWSPPTCFTPTNISTGTITTTSAEIIWTAPLQVPALGYDVYFNTTGIEPDNTTVLNSSNSVTAGSTAVSAILNSLTSSTQYFVWVRSKCTPTDNSFWSMVGLFNTVCVPLNVPYAQNFDTTAVGSSTNNTAPACWSYLETSGSAGYGYVSNSTNSNSLPNSFYMYNSTDITGDNMLVSPETINLSSGTNRVRFFAKGTSAGYPLQIGTLANPTDPTTFTIIGAPIILTTTQTEYTIDIPAGTNSHLAFKHGMNSTNDAIYIDDINIEPMPTCLRPTDLFVNTVTTSTANVSWTASISAPANGYEVYYSTSNIAPTATTVLDVTNSVTSNGTSTTITGLTPSTTYYFWVRAVCSVTDSSYWSTENSFTTNCVAFTIPYSENFDTTATGSSTNNTVPTCWRYLESTGFAGYGYVANSTNSNSLPNSFYMNNSTDVTGDMMLVSPNTTNLSSGTNRVRFFAKGTAAGYPIEIGTLSNSIDPTTFTIIGSPIILTTTQTEYIVNIPAGTNTFVAFRHGMNSTSDIIYIDDINVEVMPTCVEPTALQVTTGSITSTGGDLTWTSAITPTTGYEVYYSTVNTAPTATTVLDATNSVAVSGTTATLAGLSPSTTYFIWIRSVCSSTDKSIWTANPITITTLCQPPAITGTSVTPTPVCVGGTATLNATADAGATINWYDAATGGNLLTTGPTYTTPVLTATTDYYVSASNGNTENVGPVNPAALGTISASNYAIGTYYQIFDVISPTNLVSIDVFPVSTVAIGTNSAIEIKDNTGATLISVPYTVSVNDGVTPQTVILNYPLAIGTGYRIGQGIGINLNRNTTGAVYPVTSSAINITGNNFASGPDYWYYIYNWVFSTACESPRTTVTATYDSTCTLGTSEAMKGNEVSIYPNPFTDVINISDIKNVVSVSVTDLSGRVVKTITKPSYQINLSELKTGMYLITLKYKDGSVKTVKAIKK